MQNKEPPRKLCRGRQEKTVEAASSTSSPPILALILFLTLKQATQPTAVHTFLSGSDHLPTGDACMFVSLFHKNNWLYLEGFFNIIFFLSE